MVSFKTAPSLASDVVVNQTSPHLVRNSTNTYSSDYSGLRRISLPFPFAIHFPRAAPQCSPVSFDRIFVG